MGRRIALRSMANGKLVTAENAGNEPLIANRDAIGPWETFEEIVVDSGAPEPAPEPSPPQPVPLGAKWRGSSDFRLLQRFLTDEDIDGVLQERLDAGAKILPG